MRNYSLPRISIIILSLLLIFTDRGFSISKEYGPGRSADVISTTYLTDPVTGYLTRGQLINDSTLYYGPSRQVNLAATSGILHTRFAGGYVQSGYLDGNATVYYGPSVQVDLIDGLEAWFGGGYFKNGYIDGDQAFGYGPSRTVVIADTSFVAIGSNYYIEYAYYLGGDQTLDYGNGGWHGYPGGEVDLASLNEVTFADGYVTSGVLDGDQSFPYASDSFGTVVASLADGSPVEFLNEFISTGYLASDQDLKYGSSDAANYAEFAAYEYVTFDANDTHFLLSGTLTGPQDLEYHFLRPKANFDLYVTFNPSGGLVASGFLSSNQSLNYYWNAGTSTGRTVVLKAYVLVTFLGMSSCVKTGVTHGAQTLTTSTGTANVGDNAYSVFTGGYVGGYYIP